MSEEKPCEQNQPVPVQELASEMGLSRDVFFESFRKFQSDLYREDLTQETLAKVLKHIRTNEGCLGQVALSQFSIKTVRYRKDGDIDRALKLFYQSAYQSASRLDMPIFYVLKKESGVVTINVGAVEPKASPEDLKAVFKENSDAISDMLLGFLPGTECEVVSSQKLFPEDEFVHRRVIVGVPGSRNDNKDDKNRRRKDEDSSSGGFGIERVVDSVADDFIIVGISVPVRDSVVEESRAIFSAAHDFFQVLAKHTEQVSESIAKGKNISHQIGTSHQESEKGVSTTSHEGDAILTSLNKMRKRWWGAKGWFRGENSPTSRRDLTVNKPGDVNGESQSDTVGESETDTNQRGVSVERTNELAKQTAELIAKQLKRLRKGRASGMWRHTTQVLAKKNLTAKRVADILCGYLVGNDETASQVRSVRIPDEHDSILPVLDMGIRQISCLDSALGLEYSGISTLMTSEELARICALPFHDVPGIVVEKLTDFGRNLSQNTEDKSVKIGDVIDHECETKREVRIGHEQLNRHMFVTGATGAGKSTTMRQLLLNLYRPGADEHVPFLVIEPVKREYRELKKYIPELQVITLGEKNCDIALSPFSVERELGLIPHIDNLKAAFNASMGNYSSMPFILEEILYRAYEQCGWDLATGENPLIDKFAEARIPVPTIPKMEDLKNLVKPVIESFFEDRPSDYGNSLYGALNARIGSMTRGAKGNVLNRIDNVIDVGMLLGKPCVIELWPFTDNEEKAFVMALIMIKLYEYRQKLDILINNNDMDANVDQKLKHVLVIEEAHRLLAKQQSAGEHSSSGRQKAVEFFADILAEIRSYGQGIVIVDQIPSKLIPDVLKNTDVKIAHRLADKEDREVIGGTMNLTKEQIGEVSRLKPGVGVVYYSGLRQAVKIKVPRESNVEKEIKDREEAKKFFD